MTPVEFDLALNKLLAEFPKGQAYGEGKRKLIYQAVCHLPQFNFERIVKHFILSARQLPTPRDIIDAAKKEGIKNEIHERDRPAPPVTCEWCCDGGVMELIAKHNKRTYFIRCNCEFGTHSFRTELIQWSPSMSSHFDPINMAEVGFRKWKPKAFNPEDPEGSLKDLAELWKLQMQLSVAFWNELMPDGGGAA